jgi:hypothetical protein
VLEVMMVSLAELMAEPLYYYVGYPRRSTNSHRQLQTL